MIAEELQNQLGIAISDLNEGLNEHRNAATEKGIAEFEYRQAQAIAYLDVMRDAEHAPKKPTEPHIKALVDRRCLEEMRRLRTAEAILETSQQRLISRRAEMSALQSMMGAHKAEAEMFNYANQHIT